MIKEYLRPNHHLIKNGANRFLLSAFIISVKNE